MFVESTGAEANGAFTDQSGAFVFDLVERSLADNPELAEASSLATTVGWLAEVPGASSLPPTGLDMLQAYESAPPALQEILVADDGNATQVLFQVGPSSLEQRAVVLDNVERAINDPGDGALLPKGASATTGGLAVVGVGLLENITANRAELTIVALILVGAFVVLRSRDLARGLLTMIPVLLAVGTSATLVRVLGITLSPLTTVGGPLVVATCAEFSVLLVARYAEERAKDLGPEQSTKVAAQHTGRAFFTSALTVLGGFAVLMFSSLPLLADFGMVVTINIGVALLAALVVVPPLLEEADRRGLLAMGPVTAEATAGARDRRRVIIGWVSGVLLVVLGLGVAATALGADKAVEAEALRSDAVESPATLPPPTTVAPTTIPPSTLPGETTLPPDTLPPGAGRTTDGPRRRRVLRRSRRRRRRSWRGALRSRQPVGDDVRGRPAGDGRGQQPPAGGGQRTVDDRSDTMRCHPGAVGRRSRLITPTSSDAAAPEASHLEGLGRRFRSLRRGSARRSPGRGHDAHPPHR